ncbi:MAG: cobalamin B12-binding domain-containing protein [Dehalococcoidia bacterium]
MSQQRIRVLLAKPGLDGHDRGIIVVAMALRDAGMEVIYTGRHQTPDQIAQAAVQEDVDVVGLSSLADAHRVQAPRVVAKLAEKGRGDIPVVLGGFIQPEDIDELKAAGVTEVFGSGSKMEAIVEFIRGLKK